MNPRLGLNAGVAVTAVVAVILAAAPTSWLADMLEVSGTDATTFLVRRYAASATVALLVVTAGIALHLAPRRAALQGLAAWFGVQAVVAIWAITSGTVGGLVWLAVFADPLIAVWFLLLSSRADNVSSVGPQPHRSPDTAL